MKRNVVIVSLLLFVHSCQQSTKVQNYPNEMSEMALSMRTMVDKLKQAKKDIEQGVTPNLCSMSICYIISGLLPSNI